MPVDDLVDQVWGLRQVYRLLPFACSSVNPIPGRHIARLQQDTLNARQTGACLLHASSRLLRC